jgi:hypothetical protein
VTPPSPPATPKPKPQPAPPLPVWPPANADYSKVCPECNQYAQAISKLQAEIAQGEKRAAALQSQLSKAQAEAANAEAEIKRAQNELKAQESTGGSAFDPDTGLTTEAFTQPDGRVRIRVIDGSGKVLEERFRDRRDLTAARKRLADNEQKLKQARAEEARAQQALGKAQQEIARAKSALRSQQALYEECIEKCRRKVLFGEPPMAQVIAVPVPQEFSGGGAAPSTPILSTLPGAVTLATPFDPGALDEVRAACRECEQAAKDVNQSQILVNGTESTLSNLEEIQAASEIEEEKLKIRIHSTGAGAPDAIGKDLLQRQLVALQRTNADSEREIDRLRGVLVSQSQGLQNAQAKLKKCIEEKCKDFGVCAIEIERINNIIGNNPFNPLDPLADDSNQSSSSESSQVVSAAPASCTTGITAGFRSCTSTCVGGPLSTNVTISSGQVTLTSFGVGNPSATFCNGVSNSSTLVFFGSPDHRCTLSGSGPSFSFTCLNNNGAGPGSCSGSCF